MRRGTDVLEEGEGKRAQVVLFRNEATRGRWLSYLATWRRP